MRFEKRWLLCGAALSVPVLSAACARACGGGGGTPQSSTTAGGQQAVQPKTRVEMVVHGGFAYVPGDNKLEIGLMKSFPLPETPQAQAQCKVQQVGYELRVDDGDMVDPAGSGRSFDPTGAEITIEGSQGQPSGVLNIQGRGPATNGDVPTNPKVEANWQDMKFVPTLTQFYPNNPLHSNWRGMVDGRVVLTHGTVTGGLPSDQAAINGKWHFTRTSDTTTFDQAVTDRVRYSVEVPGDQVVINLTNVKSGPNRIVVKSTAGRPVALVLLGRHPAGQGGPIPTGMAIDHFCAFYELMDPKPSMAERLIPHFALNTAVPANNQPTPGRFCPGLFW